MGALQRWNHQLEDHHALQRPKLWKLWLKTLKYLVILAQHVPCVHVQQQRQPNH